MRKKPHPHEQIGDRLRAVREFFEPDLLQRQFAEKHKFNATQYTNWESGSRRIPVEAATALEDYYGVSLDFIYIGRLAMLPHRFAIALSDKSLVSLTSKDKDTPVS